MTEPEWITLGCVVGQYHEWKLTFFNDGHYHEFEVIGYENDFCVVGVSASGRGEHLALTPTREQAELIAMTLTLVNPA